MIRQATKEDFPDILRLYKAGLIELCEDFEEERLKEKVLAALQLAPCFLVVIDDKIVGMSGLTLGISSHNGVATLVDYMFYVSPEHRSIKTLGGLMDEIKRFATANNFPVKLEFISHNDEELRKRLFRRYGFRVYAVVGVYNDT